MTAGCPMQIGTTEHPLADRFIADLAGMVSPLVIELGTRRWSEDLITHHKAWAPHADQYVMTDIEDGQDVDIVLDAHDMWLVGTDGTDALIAVATWEHLRYPWVAAKEVFRVLRSGGIAYVQTHMAFPEHGTYGGDFTRWTKGGLSALFEWAGFETVDASHTYPCEIIPPLDVQMGRWNPGAPAWLCVDWYGRKP